MIRLSRLKPRPLLLDYLGEVYSKVYVKHPSILFPQPGFFFFFMYIYQR